MNQQTNQSKELNHWAVYGICLLISTIFFFLFGLNSPLQVFNFQADYQWVMTMGHGLVNGKIPYRDLFEQRGPLVHFVTAFCCLFPKPNIIMFFLEIFSMSLFFFFAYRICKKRLNTFWSLVAIPILAYAIFTGCETRIGDASTIEEFCLPIYACFLLIWLEFLIENKNWNWIQSICLGIFFGILFWTKYTMLFFIAAPMLIWFILNLRHHQYRILIGNLLCMLAGILIITLPILIFYAYHHAIDDLFYVYFFVNFTAYRPILSINILILNITTAYRNFFLLGAAVLFFMIYGIIRYTIYYRNTKGILLLLAFFANLLLLFFSSECLWYYYIQLFPYAILGITDVLYYINTKINLRYTLSIFLLTCFLSIACCLPHRVSSYEFLLDEEDYVQLEIAKTIHNYEKEHNTKATLFCYRMPDRGFYNAAGIIPSNYFYAKNGLNEDRFPKMYESFDEQIRNQTSDFVIVTASTWTKKHNFLSQYYQPYNNDLETNTYINREYQNVFFSDIYILLFRK